MLMSMLLAASAAFSRSKLPWKMGIHLQGGLIWTSCICRKEYTYSRPVLGGELCFRLWSAGHLQQPCVECWLSTWQLFSFFRCNVNIYFPQPVQAEIHVSKYCSTFALLGPLQWVVNVERSCRKRIFLFYSSLSRLDPPSPSPSLPSRYVNTYIAGHRTPCIVQHNHDAIIVVGQPQPQPQQQRNLLSTMYHI